MNLFRHRKRAKAEHLTDVTAKMIHARSLTLDALHEATDVIALEHLVNALEALDQALRLNGPRLADSDNDLKVAIAARPPRI